MRLSQPSAPPSSRQRTRRRVFALLALVIVPALVFGVAELALRLIGLGYPTSFFLKKQQGGKAVYVENPDFGLRFFPKTLARSAAPVLLPAGKGGNTFRVFVLGESAALGDPEPAFGFGRYLEALLTARYPETHFEVVCAAMTAINSHALLPVARECAKLDGDLWVIYVGNNEMVGPFGAATVLGPKAPPLFLIRASLALKRLRVVQVLSALVESLQTSSDTRNRWEGMKMFVGAEVAPNDPARRRSEAHFERNLADMLQVAQRAGVKVVLCTLASNLKDSAPFGSLHAGGLTETAQRQWDNLYAAGTNGQASDRSAEAITNYLQASTLDPSFADLEFRLGRSWLAAGNTNNALHAFERARDDDALPFRAGSRINSIIRELARQAKGVSFADAEQAFAHSSTAGVPGRDLFYEHVHFNFAGNYQLARLVANEVKAALPEGMTRSDQRGWLSQAACENSLAVTDWDRHRVYQNIRQREDEAPFILQLNHGEQVRALDEDLHTFRQGMNRSSIPAAVELYQHALAAAPNDFQIHANYAKLLTDTGALAEAATEWERVKALLPGRPGPALYLAKTSLRLGRYAQAESALREVIALRGDLPEAWDDLAQALNKEHRLEESIRACQRGLQLAPSNAVLHLHMADALAAQGKRGEAVAHLEEAVRNRPNYWEARYLLGVEYAMDDRFAEASQQFATVVQMRPQFAPGHLNYGVALVKQNKLDEALGQFLTTAQLEPTNRMAVEYISRLQSLKSDPPLLSR